MARFRGGPAPRIAAGAGAAQAPHARARENVSEATLMTDVAAALSSRKARRPSARRAAGASAPCAIAYALLRGMSIW